MQFDHEGKTYPFNQIFDGWRLALACAASIATGGAVDLALESGDRLSVRYNDVLKIEKQLRETPKASGHGEL